MAQDETAGAHGGTLAFVACASAVDREELQRCLSAGGHRTVVPADTTSLLDSVLEARPDVLIVDLELALGHVGSVPDAITEHPDLASLPVLLMLPEDSIGPLPPNVAPFVSDIVFRPIVGAELLHRATSAITRRRRHQAQREASARVRGAMRRISVSIKATNDPTVMMERFLSGAGQALGAQHTALQIFDDERVAARSGSWSADGHVALPVPRHDHRPRDLELALELWEENMVATVRAGISPVAAVAGAASSPPRGVGTGAPRAPGVIVAPDWILEALGADAAVSGVALPLGEGDTPFGLLWIVSGKPFPWTGLAASLTQHVLGNLAHGLIQAQLISRQQQAVRKLRALNQAKNDFVGSVNHELRTPLASITGYLEVILDGVAGELPPDVRTMLQAVERNTAKLNQLIENISSLSARRTDESEHGPVDLAHLVADLTRSMVPEAANAGIALACFLPETAVVVSANREELGAAFGIVLSNAIKFTRANGSVTTDLTIDHDGDSVTLAVRDTGIGIPPDDLPRLFDPFQRAANTQQALPGAGIGLAVARKTLEAHLGTIGITSELGVGTTVTITLPLLDHAAAGLPEFLRTETP